MTAAALLAELALGVPTVGAPALLLGEEKGGDRCDGCTCSNEVALQVASFLPVLYVDTLTTVLMTVAAVGVLCSVVFALYLSCKTCGEVVEGSQVRKKVAVHLLMQYLKHFSLFSSAAIFVLML